MRYLTKHQKISFVGMFMDYYGLENLYSQDYNKGISVCKFLPEKAVCVQLIPWLYLPNRSSSIFHSFSKFVNLACLFVQR